MKVGMGRTGETGESTVLLTGPSPTGSLSSSWSHWTKAEATEQNSSIIPYFKNVYMTLQASISTPVPTLWIPKCLPFRLSLKFNSTVIYKLRAGFSYLDRPTSGL